MHVAPLPQHPRSLDLLGRPALESTTRGEPLSWDHFDVEVTASSLPVVVRCRGGLDFAYTDELRAAFARISDRDVVVDLSGLSFVDSTGLSVLLSARRAVLDVGGTMAIRGASGMVRRVFEVSELADVLDD